jgi:hypothetical protein
MLTQKGVSVMKVIAGAMGLVVALTLTVAAGAFAQMTPQGDGNANNVTTNTTNGPDNTSTDPTTTPPTEEPITPAPTAQTADCASEIEGMNAVLNALPIGERNSLGGTGQLPDIPCAGYHYAADFTIVPDTPPAAPTVPQAQEEPTQTGTQT